MTELQHCPRGGDAPGLPDDSPAPAALPDSQGFPGLVCLVFFLAERLGECTSAPGAPDDWKPLQRMASGAMRAWCYLLAEHDPAITRTHQRISQARRQGLATVEVPPDLLALLIGLPAGSPAPAFRPEHLGFTGLTFCLADCLGECASTPGARVDRELLQRIASTALQTWRAMLAEHGQTIAHTHQQISQAHRQGLTAVAVPADLLALLIGEGQP